MKILHIIRKKGEGFPQEVIRQHQRTDAVSLLLLHDAVFLYDGLKSEAAQGLTAYACKDDLLARGMSAGQGALTYPEIVSLVWENDRVFCW